MSIVFNLFLLHYGGTTAVAAFAIVMYVDEVVGMLNFGISDSMQPAISHCYGAGLIERRRPSSSALPPRRLSLPQLRSCSCCSQGLPWLRCL